jgi:cytochrome b561
VPREYSRVDPRPRIPRYDRVAIALHWLLVPLIVGALAVGTTMVDLPLTPLRLKLYNWHKWAGIVILGGSILRLAWRLAHRPPAAPPMPDWQRHAARVSHGAMYALFLAVPLAGWAYSSAAGFPVVLFGVLPLPDWVAADRELAERIKPVHGALAYTLAALVAVHVAAAFKHQWVDRDRLLARMWPGRG